VEFRADALELPVGTGWYAAEEEYTCTTAEAWCRLQPPLEGPAMLELVASAPHPDLAEHPLFLEVKAGGQVIGSTFFTVPWQARQLFFSIPEPGQVLSAARELDFSGRPRPLKVELRVDRAYRPDELFRDGRDPREIGLAVRRMGVGTVAEAAKWAAEGVGVDDPLRRLSEHVAFLERAIAEKDAFHARELEGKERLIAQLQANLERYHATPPFRAYFALKRLLGR
jgi:hypothetical protein